MVTHATSLFAEHADAVCLINHYRAVVFVLQFDNLRQFSQIAFHREHAIDDNQLHSVVWKFLQYALKVFHVVVFVFQLVCKREASAVNDRGVVTVVADDVVFPSSGNSNYTGINGESGREA